MNEKYAEKVTRGSKYNLQRIVSHLRLESSLWPPGGRSKPPRAGVHNR